MNWRALDSLQKLTPAQRAKLNAIRDSYRTQVQRLRGQTSGPGEVPRRVSVLAQTTLKQIDAVLTPAQRAEYRRLREQGGPGPGFMGGPPMGGGLPPGIRLTAAQQKAYQSLQKRFDAQSVRIRQGKGTPDQKRTQMMALMRDRWNRTRALLTPAQRAQLPPQGFGGPRGFGMRFSMDPKEALDRMASELSLTPAQRKQAQPIVSKHLSAMRAMRAIVIPGSPPDPALREKMRAERQAMNTELSRILTPAQQQKLRAERGGMGRGPGQGMGQGPGGRRTGA